MPKSAPNRTEPKLGHLKAVAQAAGVKLTHQRLEIFRELAGTEGHPDAETIFRAVQQRVPTMSLDTVYRTLWLLHGLGLVATLGPQRDRVRFDTNLDPHHHYVCIRCELVRDFASEALNGLRVPDAARRFGSIVQTQVEVRGLCAQCQKSQESTAPKAAPQKQRRSRS